MRRTRPSGAWWREDVLDMSVERYRVVTWRRQGRPSPRLCDNAPLILTCEFFEQPDRRAETRNGGKPRCRAADRPGQWHQTLRRCPSYLYQGVSVAHIS